MKKENNKITIDDLALMTKRGFDEVGENIKKGFETVNNNIRILSENNAREHEEIKLRLDNVAYRFELVELQKRVEVLEKKAGLKQK
jgi:endonuclease IV